MNSWLSALSLLLPVGAVMLLTRPALAGRGWATRLEWVGVCAPLALGATSMVFLAWRAAGGNVRTYAMAETAAVGLLVVLLLYRARKQGHAKATTFTQQSEPFGLTVASAGLIAATLVASSLYLIARIDALPHGEWDAWAIWNLRAAFLATPTSAWLDGFTPAIAWSHPDYPLLLPASVARLWSFAGFESIAAPVIFESVVVVALVAVTAGTLLTSSGSLAAALGLSLLVVPEFLLQATTQGADVVMSLFVLMSVALLAQPATVARLVLAGLAAGFAAWTKNEGLVAALALVIAFAAVVILKEGVGAAIRKGKWLIAGLLPGVCALAMFSIAFAPPKDLLTGIAGTGPLAKLADFERHRRVAVHMLSYLAQWGRWSAVAPVWFLAAWFAAALFRYRRVPDAVLVGWLTLAVMLAAYYTVYVLTPYDLTWHLATSWPRLIAQIWPLLVWSAVSGAFTTDRSSLPPHPEAARR